MKLKFLFIALGIVLLSTISTNAQNKLQAAKHPVVTAEDQPMKTYVMVFLKAGKNRTQSAPEAKKIQEQHMQHLDKMHKEGKLLMAGPFTDEHEIKGILVMNSLDIDEVKDFVEQDPAILAGRLVAEYHLWYTKSGTITLP